MSGTLVRDFAGARRTFRLGLGEIFDLEEACGKVGIGTIYTRIAGHSYFLKDVMHTTRLALIGGGMAPGEAEQLVQDRVNAGLLVDLQAVAVDILVARFAGIEPDDAAAGEGDGGPLDVGEILSALVQLGISPDQVRAMDYADFVALVRALGGKDAQAPSEDEFAEMIRNSQAMTK